MLKRICICFAALFAFVLFTFLGLCLYASFYGQGTTSCQLASGRQIVATATGVYIGLETRKDTAIIRTLGSKVSILPTSLQVDDRQVAAIPATTKVVHVFIKRGEVTFIADEKTVGSLRR
jgi:hypothetical protein